MLSDYDHISIQKEINKDLAVIYFHSVRLSCLRIPVVADFFPFGDYSHCLSLLWELSSLAEQQAFPALLCLKLITYMLGVNDFMSVLLRRSCFYDSTSD